ncbi:MAG: porin family protein [Bacteroidia bacterium]
MKNYKIIVILILVILSNKLWSQKRFIPGLKAGVSTSQVAGDNYSGYNKAGFIGGGTLTAQFSEKYAGHFEIMYIQKGSQHNGNQEKGDYNFYFLELDYIEVPLLFQFHQRKFTYEVGPAIAFLIGEEEFFNFFNLTGANPFNKNEISINAGLNYSIYKGLGINWRFSHSITPIRAHASGATRWYNPGQMNNVLTFTLTYKFNQNNAE